MKKINFILIAFMSFPTLVNASPYSKAIRHEENINNNYREIYDGVWSTDNIDNRTFNSNKSGEEIYAGVWRKEVTQDNKKIQINNNLNESNINIVNRGNTKGNDKKNNKEKIKVNNNNNNTIIGEVKNIENDDDILSILN